MSAGGTKGKSKPVEVPELFVFEILVDDSEPFSVTSPRKNAPIEEIVARRLRKINDVKDMSKVQFTTPDNQLIPHGTLLDQIGCSKCFVKILPGATNDPNPPSPALSHAQNFSSGGSPNLAIARAGSKQGVFARAATHSGDGPRKGSVGTLDGSRPTRSKNRLPQSAEITSSLSDILESDLFVANPRKPEPKEERSDSTDSFGETVPTQKNQLE